MMKKNYLLFFIMMVCWQINAQTVAINEVTLGNVGTSVYANTPIDPDDNYSYSQSIYLQSEINQSGSISKITYYTDGSLENSNEVVVYMGETSNDLFAETTEWLALTDLTQVYSGTFEVYGNEVVIVLDTPFAYSNTANLVIAVDENAEGNDGKDFINHNTGVSGRALEYSNNTTNPDPATPPTGSKQQYRANIELDFNTITCMSPNALEVPSTTATSAQLSWTSSASAWEYVVQVPSEMGTINEAAAVDADATTMEVIDLLANTAYEFYVRTDCDTDGVSDWVGPYMFRTGCAPIADFTESFETMPADLETPYCWNTILTSTGTAAIVKVVNSNYNSDDGANYYSMAFNNDDGVYLISPESNIIADGMHRVEFAAKRSTIYTGEEFSLKVGLMSDPEDESTFVELQSFQVEASYSDFYVNVPLNAGFQHLVFKPETSATANRTLYLDDIVVTTQPTCFQVLDMAADNITDTAFDVTVTVDYQTQTEWELAVIPSELLVENFDPSTVTPIVTSALTTNVSMDSNGNAVTANSLYTMYARANCEAVGSDGTGVSEWYGPFEMRTGCAPTTDDFSENFDTLPDDLPIPFCWDVISETTGSTEPVYKVNYSTSQANTGGNYYEVSSFNNDDTFYLIAPQSTIISDGMHRVEFGAKVNATSGGDSTLKVGVMSNPNDATTFVEIQSFILGNSSDETGNYTMYYVNIPENLTSQNLAFKMQTEATSSKTFYLDSIEVTEQPACLQILDMAASNIEATSFNVDLTADYQTQTEWELVVKQTDLNFDPSLETPVATSSLTTNITLDSAGNAILPNSEYRVFARANCDAADSDGSGFGEWFGPFEILTACASYEMDDLSYPEMFEAANNAEIIPCWSMLSVGGTGYVKYSTLQEYDGESSARFYLPSGGSSSDYVFLVSPALSDLGSDKQIRFWVYDDSNATLAVGTMSDPTNATTFTELQRFNNGVTDDFETLGEDTVDDMTDDTWQELTVDFSEYNGTDQYIAFRVIKNASWVAFYIDAFTYEINSTLSLNDFEGAAQVSIYPNPANDILQVEGEGLAKVEIYNINGQKVFGSVENLETIDVSHLTSGMYFVEITNNKGNTAVKKLLKE